MANKEPLDRKIDVVISEHTSMHQDNVNRSLQWLYIPLITFGLLGMIWAVPFPHLDFLGKYNGFVNWASFVIAFSIYYYYKISPVLSYGILLVIFGFSAAIVGLEKLDANHGWPPLGTVCAVIFLFGLILQFIGFQREGRIPTFLVQLKAILNNPLALMYLIFKKAGFKA